MASIKAGVIGVGFIEVYAAVRDGGRMPDDPTWPTFEASYQANVAVDAILQSAREQRWVAIEY